MKQVKLLTGIFAIIIGLIIQSCQPYQPNVIEEVASVEIQKALCVLYPTKGNEVEGMVTFTQTDSGVLVSAAVSGLTEGKHGFHIHEYGNCSAPDGTSAGGHFNPENEKHGGPDHEMRHVGDMGNLDADENGNALLEYVDTKLSLEGEHSIIGRGMIVHAGKDDLTSQPTGAAGARVACGVIGIAAESPGVQEEMKTE
jgi:Cu-Zn family superoxide dismutase